MQTKLGRDGPGAFHIPEALTEGGQRALLEEIANPEAIEWRDVHETYTNMRGKEIIQNHDVFGLKLSRGDQSYVERVPHMHQLARETERFVQSLHTIFPTLLDWSADEMSYHYYDDPEVGLSYHKDNLRFPGLVAVVTVEGTSDFNILNETERTEITDSVWHSTYTVPVKPRSLVLMRAPGLLDESPHEDIRPEHAVLNVHDKGRIAFMLRDNNKPDDSSYGFTYENWP